MLLNCLYFFKLGFANRASYRVIPSYFHLTLTGFENKLTIIEQSQNQRFQAHKATGNLT